MVARARRLRRRLLGAGATSRRRIGEPRQRSPAPAGVPVPGAISTALAKWSAAGAGSVFRVVRARGRARSPPRASAQLARPRSRRTARARPAARRVGRAPRRQRGQRAPPPCAPLRDARRLVEAAPPRRRVAAATARRARALKRRRVCSAEDGVALPPRGRSALAGREARGWQPPLRSARRAAFAAGRARGVRSWSPRRVVASHRAGGAPRRRAGLVAGGYARRSRRRAARRRSRRRCPAKVKERRGGLRSCPETASMPATSCATAEPRPPADRAAPAAALPRARRRAAPRRAEASPPIRRARPRTDPAASLPAAAGDVADSPALVRATPQKAAAVSAAGARGAPRVIAATEPLGHRPAFHGFRAPAPRGCEGGGRAGTACAQRAAAGVATPTPRFADGATAIFQRAVARRRRAEPRRWPRPRSRCRRSPGAAAAASPQPHLLQRRLRSRRGARRRPAGREGGLSRRALGPKRGLAGLRAAASRAYAAGLNDHCGARRRRARRRLAMLTSATAASVAVGCERRWLVAAMAAAVASPAMAACPAATKQCGQAAAARVPRTRSETATRPDIAAPEKDGVVADGAVVVDGGRRRCSRELPAHDARAGALRPRSGCPQRGAHATSPAEAAPPPHARHGLARAAALDLRAARDTGSQQVEAHARQSAGWRAPTRGSSRAICRCR